MKLTALIAGVAAVALTAGAAAAQTAPNYNTYVNRSDGAGTDSADRKTTVEASFSVTASVNPACVIGNNGDTMKDLDFGNVGIYVNAANGIENAFTMIGARNGHSRTNVAGCNTANTLTLSKGNGALGLTHDNSNVSYDSGVFQTNIPYTLGGVYTSVSETGGAQAPTRQTRHVYVNATQVSNTVRHGAWKSELGIRVDLPVTSKALVAGTYSDTVTVNLSALL